MLQRRLCAAALVVTAAIHLAVVPEHLQEWPAAGWFFVQPEAATRSAKTAVFFDVDVVMRSPANPRVKPHPARARLRSARECRSALGSPRQHIPYDGVRPDWRP